MALRKMLPIALSASALFLMARADAQSPFTILRPPDDATVREKVRVEIPRKSIKDGGFVAFYIDDKFYIALSPKTEGDSEIKPFTFIWDTKEAGISDGQHSVKAILYEPAEGANKVAVTEKSVSEVKVIVANKIKDGPKSLTLRYKYRNGANLTYNRDSKSLIVGGISPNGMTTSDEILSSIKSKFLLGIEDSRPAEDVALVRNKMTSLSVLAGTQESTIDPAQLAGSMFQELNAQGKVLYETGGQDLGGMTSAEGQPILTTLELPLLPLQRITVGSTWVTPAERLDIPGLPPQMQPRVPLQNKFMGLEWEGGFKTAKIHQEVEAKLPAITFGAIEVTSPNVKYERDIYVAYTSGTLVKTTRTITISGKTLSDAGAPPESGMSGGGGGMAAGGAMMGAPGGGSMGRMGSAPGGSMGRMGGPPPGMMGGASMGRMGSPPGAGGGGAAGSMYGGYSRPGSGGGMSGGGGAGSGSMGRMGGAGGGSMGRMGGRNGKGDGDSGMSMGMPGRSGGVMGSGMGMPNRGGGGGNTGGDPMRPITLKSIAETEFQSVLSYIYQQRACLPC